MRTIQTTVGRTPWSARVPLDPLFAQPNQPDATIITERPVVGKLCGVRATGFRRNPGDASCKNDPPDASPDFDPSPQPAETEEVTAQ